MGTHLVSACAFVLVRVVCFLTPTLTVRVQFHPCPARAPARECACVGCPLACRTTLLRGFGFKLSQESAGA